MDHGTALCPLQCIVPVLCATLDLPCFSCKEDYDKLLEYKEKCKELIIENEVLTDKYKKVLELSSDKLRHEMRMKREVKRSASPKRESPVERRRPMRSRSNSRDRELGGLGGLKIGRKRYGW